MEALLFRVFTEGLTPPIFMMLFQLLIVIFIVMAIKDWMSGVIKRRLAYRRLKSNKYLKNGSWIKLPTNTDPILAQIDDITPTTVVAVSGELGEEDWHHIPIMKFAGDPLVLPTTVPATSLIRDGLARK